MPPQPPAARNMPDRDARRKFRNRRRRRRLQTLLTLSPWVIGSVAVAVGLLWLLRDLSPNWPPGGEIGLANNDIVGNALQTLGTVYAVLLGFVVMAVWGQFNDARASVEREANAIADLHRVLAGLPGEEAAHARDDLRAYLRGVLDEEWDAMRLGDHSATLALSADLEMVWRDIRNMPLDDDLARSYHFEALGRFNDLSDARAERLRTGQIRIPFALRAVLYLGAVTTVGAMYLLHVESFGIHACTTGALAGAIAHVMYVVEDLDSAFTGDWRIEPEPLERLEEHLDGA